MDLQLLKQYADVLTKGIVIEAAPKMAAGALVRLFQAKKIDRAMVRELIRSDASLWGKVGENHRNMLRELARRVGDLSWITPGWAIESLRRDFPGIASLFLNDEPALTWLTAQLEELKKGL